MTYREYYCNRYIYINNYAINFMSKCGCSTLGYYGYIQKYGNTFLRGNEKSIHEYDFKHFKYNNIDSNINYHAIINKYCLVNYEDIDRTKYKTVAIFRDPIERIISARNPLINEYKLNNTKEYFKWVINQLMQSDLNNLDQHIIPQYFYYNFNNIDLFIELKNLHICLRSIGLKPLKLNQTPKDLYKDDPYNNDEIFNIYYPILKKLYNNDYILIDKIKSSNKLWKPQIYHK